MSRFGLETLLYSAAIALIALLMFQPLYANTIYIGDSIAHGYRIAAAGNGVTRVGATPAEVLRMVDRSPVGDYAVLSTGASNQCADTTNVGRVIYAARKKYARVLLLSAPRCGRGVSAVMWRMCTDNCEFRVIRAGPDGIHPKRYSVIADNRDM